MSSERKRPPLDRPATPDDIVARFIGWEDATVEYDGTVEDLERALLEALAAAYAAWIAEPGEA